MGRQIFSKLTFSFQVWPFDNNRSLRPRGLWERKTPYPTTTLKKSHSTTPPPLAGASGLQNRRDFLRFSGKQRQAQGKHGARFTHHGSETETELNWAWLASGKRRNHAACSEVLGSSRHALLPWRSKGRPRPCVGGYTSSRHMCIYDWLTCRWFRKVFLLRLQLKTLLTKDHLAFHRW